MSDTPAQPGQNESEAWIDHKLRELRALSFETLSALPEESLNGPEDDRFECQGVYREKLPDGRLKIVVQAMAKRRFWSFSGMWVKGFHVSPDGEWTVLPDKDLWEYT
jgi:hypothetical protein